MNVLTLIPSQNEVRVQNVFLSTVTTPYEPDDDLVDDDEPLHPPLEGENLSIALQAFNRLESVLPVEQEDWIDGFRFEVDLEQEIALWDHISSLYQRVVSEISELDLAQKQKVLHLLLYCSTAPKKKVLEHFPGDDFLSRPQVETIVDEYFKSEFR